MASDARDALGANDAAAGPAIAAVTGGSARSNQPPEPMAPEVLLDLLKERHADLTKRQAELLAASERFHKQYAKIETEEIAGRAAQFQAQLGALVKKAEAEHEPEKAPWLTNGRTVDAFFRKLWEPIQAEQKKIKAKQLAYAEAQAEASRKAAAEEAARKQREAQDAAARAAEAMTPDALDTAAAKAQEAADAQALAAAGPAEHGRVRGDYGAVASLTVRWKIRAAADWFEKLAREYLTPDQGKLDLALANAPRRADKTPVLEIAGAEVYAEKGISNRG